MECLLVDQACHLIENLEQEILIFYLLMDLGVRSMGYIGQVYLIYIIYCDHSALSYFFHHDKQYLLLISILDNLQEDNSFQYMVCIGYF